MEDDAEQDALLARTDPRDAVSLEIVRTRALAELESRLFGSKPKTLRAGRYVLGEQIGSGGFGMVHRATDPLLARDVAVKILRSGSIDPSTRDTLIAESRAIAALNHPNVIRIFDVGTVQSDALGPDRAGDMYLVLELVEGQTLAAWLDEGDRTSSQILRQLVMAGRGLAAAHAADIVHLDFKPANVLVDNDGVARVLDFGLSRHVRRDPSSAELDSLPTVERRRDTTRAAIIVGTPRYMAPETHLGEQPGPAADQYALALVAVEALAHRYPFRGGDRKGLVAHKLEGLCPVALTRLGVPRGVAKALSRALSPNPTARYPSIDELVDALRPSGRSRLGLVGGTAAVGAVGLLALSSALSSAPGCDAFSSRAAALWSAHQSTIADGFEAWSAEYAGALHQRFELRVERIVRSWSAEAERYCADDRGRADAAKGRTEVCLSDRVEELSAALQRVAEGDEDALERSIGIVSIVGDPSFCAAGRGSDAMLTADPEAQREAERLRAKLYAGRAHNAAGDFKRGAAVAQEVLDEVPAEQLPAVSSEARYVLANALIGQARPKDAATNLESAYLGARAAGHERLAAVVAVRMVNVASRQLVDDALAEQWAEWADASLSRAGDPWEMRASLVYALAMKAQRNGELELAEQRYRSALATYTAHDGTLSSSACLSGLADIERSRGRPQEALALVEESLRLRQLAVGPRHPSATRLLGALGLIEVDLGNFAEARKSLAEVVARQRADNGERNPDVATALINLSTVDCLQGLHEECRRRNELAASIIAERVGDEHPFHASAVENMGYAIMASGRPAEGAVHLQRAYDALRGTIPPQHPRLVSTLLSLGMARTLAGDADKGRQHLDDALVRARSAYAEDSPKLAAVYAMRGRVAELRGEDGRRELRLALQLMDGEPPSLPHGQALLALAKSERSRGTAAARVEDLRLRARAIFEQLGNTAQLQAADALSDPADGP